MKKILFFLSFLYGTVNAQDIVKVGGRHVMSINNNVYCYASDSLREVSNRDVSLEEAFPDGGWNRTLEDTYFIITESYYTIYIPYTRTRYTVYNKGLKPEAFLNDFMDKMIYVENTRCNFDF